MWPLCKSRKTVAPQSEIRYGAGLQLQLELIGDEGDEFAIRGFSLGIADGIAEKSLQSIQIATIPGHFNGVADGTLHPAGRGLEGLCHLGVQDLGDGIDHIHVVYGDDLLDCLFLILMDIDSIEYMDSVSGSPVFSSHIERIDLKKDRSEIERDFVGKKLLQEYDRRIHNKGPHEKIAIVRFKDREAV